MTAYYTQAQIDEIGALIGQEILNSNEALKQFVQDKIAALEPVTPPAPTEPETGSGAVANQTALSFTQIQASLITDEVYALPVGNHYFACTARGAEKIMDLQLSLGNFHPVSGECIFTIDPLAINNPKAGVSGLSLTLEGFSGMFLLKPSTLTTISLKLAIYNDEYFFVSTVSEKDMIVEEV